MWENLQKLLLDPIVDGRQGHRHHVTSTPCCSLPGCHYSRAFLCARLHGLRVGASITKKLARQLHLLGMTSQDKLKTSEKQPEMGPPLHTSSPRAGCKGLLCECKCGVRLLTHNHALGILTGRFPPAVSFVECFWIPKVWRSSACQSLGQLWDRGCQGKFFNF